MNTKQLSRIVSFLLCFVMLCGIILSFCPSGVYAAEEAYQWDTGSIVDYVHYTGEKNYLDDAPFGYAYFYQGTDPNDTRSAGFYDMILAVNGGDNWFKNRYYCGATDGETTYNNRTAAIHMAAVTYPTYHYSTGYVFTAPHTGKVEFTYQYAAVNSPAVGMPFYVMRENATGYDDALKKLTAAKLANVTDKTVSEYDEITFTAEMTAGEKLYFVADSDASSKAFAHWISSVRYLPEVASMTVDRTGYVSGDSITVTTTFSNGVFGPNDCITITPKGATAPVMKKAAASLVCFEEWLAAGEYEISLLIDGMEGSAASTQIQVYTPSAVAWDNGNIIDHVHYTGEKDYLDSTPFGYAYFYQGTDPNDTRSAGFYDMILAVNGGDNWFKNRYYCGATNAENTYNNRTAAIHLAAVTYPTYHYSTGYVFTAPLTGTVEFTYQYAAANSSALGMSFYVMPESATGYNDALHKLIASKTASVTDKAASTYDEITFAVEMTAGEKLYFIADSDVSSKAFAHWISSVRLCSHPNETSYIIAPTLSSKGYTQIACAECDKKLYTKNEVAPLTCVDGWSLTLGSDLGVNFRFTIDEAVRNTAQISIAVGDDAPVLYNAMTDTVWDNSDDPHCLLTVHVAAAQMQDEIKVQILNGDDATEVKTYTVEAYARTVLENKVMSQYHQVLKDMLNYGAAAQVYFQHNHEGTLPNAGITGFGNASIPTEVVTEQIAAGAVDGIHFYGASLVYKERIAVRLYFALTSGSIEDYTFCTTDGNTLSPIFKDGLYYVEFADILPNHLNAPVNCCVLKGEQSLQIQYAPLDYIIRMNNKETSSTELTSMLQALYNYHLSTYALASTDAIIIGSNKLLSMIREGAIEENGYYTVTDGKGITFDQTDNLKTYDLKNATICINMSNNHSGLTVQADGMSLKNGSIAIYGGTAVTVSGGKDVTLSNLHFSGDGQAALKLEGIGTTVTDCTFQADAGASILQGIVATGTDITISGSTFTGLGEAIIDQSENGLVVENNTFEDCQTGISVQASGTTVWHNDFSGGDCAVSAQFEKSELSAAEANGHNLLIASNQITCTKTSVICRNTSNSVILLNQMESAAIEGNTNIYVCENTLSGQMVLTGNNYLLCNKNTASNLTAQNNTNINGDNVTDLTARAEVGANEQLLPHINTEQFVGMENREIRTADSAAGLTQYIKNQSECETVIIVPPGKYAGSRIELADLEGVTIYAYGVYNEVESTSGYAVNMVNCTDCTINGMFLGYQTYPHIQGTIVELADSNKTVVFQPDPGYIQDYSVIDTFEGRVFDNGINFGLVQYQEKSYDVANGLNTLSNCNLWGDISVGDRIAFRNPTAYGGFYFNKCSETTLEDVTIFNCSGFAESDVDNEIAPILHRYAITQGPAPILAGAKSDYDSELVYTDSYGRTRSAAPILTTLDGTHSTNARTGIQIISSLFEGTDDDMTNINGFYGLAKDYNEAEHTLTYGLSNVNGYQRLPAAFRAGDQLEMFTFDGQHIASVTAASATATLGEDHYALTLPEDFTLTAEDLNLIRSGKVVVQNRSATGNGFMIDNVKIHNIVGRMLLKGGPGTVKNCTLQGMGYNAIVAQVEVSTWPEVGYLHDVQIINNLFDSNNARATCSNDWLKAGNMVDIQIIGTGGGSVTSAEDCMNANILISGNVFKNRYANYAIRVNAVSDLIIRNNTFLPKYGETAESDNNTPILIFGGNGIIVEDNTYPENVTAVVENRFSIPGVSGNNVP